MPTRVLLLLLLLLLALPASAEPTVAYYYGGRLVYPEAVHTRGGRPVLRVEGYELVPTDEILLRFRPGADVEAALAPYTVLSRDSVGPGSALIRVPVQDPLETLRIANRLTETLPVLYASPNFVHVRPSEPEPPALRGPSSWTQVVLDDMQGTRYTVAGNPTWGRAGGGMWCAAGGTQGRDPATQNYAAGMDATLTFGPYDLSDATWAIFRMGLTAEIASDARFTVETSTDGTQFTERLAFTNTSIGPDPTLIYRVANEDSPNVNTARSLGDLRGHPAVWIRFRFTSTGEGAKGVFLYGLDVRKSTTAGPGLTADPLSGQQWSLRNVGQSGGFPGADLNIEEAWRIQTGNPDLLVAVIDDGVQLDHPDLDTVKGLSPTNEGPPDGDAPLNEEHGTACAGIIAARRDNGLGGTGIARAKIMPIRIFTSNGAGATDEQMARGIRFAMDGGARIMSNSWSGAPSDPVAFAFRDALAQDIVVVAATGNRQGQPVSFPARLPGVIAVASTNQCDEPKRIDDSSGDPYGSNTGPEVSVAAPGTQIVTCDLTGNRGVSTGDYTTAFNGTSSATPAVAGVVALMLSQNPALTPAQVKDLLQRTAVDIEGTGRPTELTGWGRVDAAAALRAVPLPAEPAALPATSADAGGGGCFVATAAYGSALDPHVGTLRAFRDRWLLPNRPGRAFVDWYYSWSPQAAERLRQQDLARAAVRAALTPLVLALEYPLAALALLLLAARRRRLALLLLVVALLAGCGGSSGGTTTSTPQPSTPDAGRLAIELQLAQNRVVPGEARTVRVTLRTPGGALVRQATFPKAPRLELADLPFGEHALTLELLDAAGVTLGTFSRSVTLVFGGTVTVRDPAFRLTRLLLQAGRLFDAGGPSRAVALHDLDGDGDLDAAAARTDGTVVVLRNDGAGELSPGPTWAADAESLAGVDGALAAATPQGVLLLPAGRNLGYPGATSLVAGDLNADGRADLAVRYEGQVVALLDLGGSFAESSRLAVPGPLASDGAQRLAAADAAAGVVRVLQSDPSGRLRVAETLAAGTPSAAAFTPTGLAVADPAAGVVRLLPGTATFPAPAARAMLAAGDRVVALDATGRAWTAQGPFHAGAAGALGDLDGDALPDLVAGAGADLAVFAGVAAGFRAPVSLAAPDAGGVTLGSFTDINQPELAVATAAGELRFFRRLQPVETRPVRAGGRVLQKGLFTDATFAHAVAVAGETGLSVYLQPFGVKDLPLAGRPNGLCVGSFGGFPEDLAVSLETAGTVAFLTCDGEGGFTPAASLAVGSHPAGLALQRSHLVVALQGQDQVAIYRQSRRTEFALLQTCDVGSGPSAVVTDDRGLRFDVYVANRGGADLSVLRQGDDGNFADGGRIPTAPRPVALALHDLDGDGLRDLAVACGAEVQVRLGTAPGAFGPPQRWLAGAENRDLAAGDADGDGLPDLAVSTGADVAVLRGR